MYIYLKSRFFEIFEQNKVKKLFYHHAIFREKDRALLSAYRKKSPYQISKKYLIEKGEKNPYQYGETPLTTLAKMIKSFKILPGDRVFELGAGRGRAALFFAEYIGCKVLAFEKISEFVSKMIDSERVEMIHGDMLEATFESATVVFLFGTMLDDSSIKKIANNIPVGVKVITVSYPFSAYHDSYETKQVITGVFPWGKTEVYLNERIF